MKEPTRWLDDPEVPSELRSVLGAAGASPPMSPHTQAKLAALAAGLVAHGAALPAAAAGSSLQAVLAWLGASSAGKAVAIVSLMGVIGSASYCVTRAVQQRSANPSVQSARSHASPRATPTVSMPVASGQSAPSVEPAVPGSTATAQPGASRPNLARSPQARIEEQAGPEPSQPSRRGTAAFDELSIADEARLLEQARASLPANPARALGIASTHEHLYPAGQLSDERELIVIDALLRLGRRQEAEQRAAPRLRQAPDSIYARRLHQLLAPRAEQ